MSKRHAQFLHVLKMRANPEYSTRQMLRNSYFWPDWNYSVRLGLFHTIFSTKGSHFFFPSESHYQIINYQIIIICRVLRTVYKHSYHTADILTAVIYILLLSTTS